MTEHPKCDSDLYAEHNFDSICVCTDCMDYRKEHGDNGH